MKRKMLGFLLCFCLISGIVSGCGTDSGSGANGTEQAEDAGGAGTADGSEPETAGDETETPAEEAAEASYYLAKEIGYTGCRSVDVDFCVEYEYEYDTNGNLIRESSFQHDSFDTETGQFGHSEATREYGYDEAGNLLFEEFIYGEGAVASTVRTEYEYDVAGNLLSEKESTIYMYDDEEYVNTSTTEYEYDESGNLISISDGFTIPKTFEYDDAGNLIRAAYGGGWTEYQYDAAGNLVMETGHADADNTDYAQFDGVMFIYEYDAAGNLIRETQNAYRNSHYARYLYEREYDASGNLIKEDEYGDGSEQITSSREYEYDEKGRIIKVTGIDYVDYDGVFYEEPKTYDTTYSYEEEYDDAGNLIKLTTYYNDYIYNYVEYEYAVQ